MRRPVLRVPDQLVFVYCFTANPCPQAAFSTDPEGARLVAICADNNHSVHVFDWQAPGGDGSAWPPSNLITVGSGGKGTPPQVWGALWNPYVRLDGKGDAERPEWSEFITYGVKHVALWRCFKDKVTKCAALSLFPRTNPLAGAL